MQHPIMQSNYLHCVFDPNKLKLTHLTLCYENGLFIPAVDKCKIFREISELAKLIVIAI